MKTSRLTNPVDRCVVFGLLFFLAASISHAGLYVSSGGDDSTHDSWSTAYATNSIFWGNGDDIVGTVTLGYCNIEDGDSGPGCISEDPLFVEASSGNYRLTRASPRVNSGYELAWSRAGTDLDGHPRLQGGIVDMGCYEVAPRGGTLLLIR